MQIEQQKINIENAKKRFERVNGEVEKLKEAIKNPPKPLQEQNETYFAALSKFVKQAKVVVDNFNENGMTANFNKMQKACQAAKTEPVYDIQNDCKVAKPYHLRKKFVEKARKIVNELSGWRIMSI